MTLKQKTKFIKIAILSVLLILTVVSVSIGFYGILIMLVIYYAVIWFYRRNLVSIRDNANFNTVRGKYLIKECNKLIEQLSGLDIFRWNT